MVKREKLKRNIIFLNSFLSYSRFHSLFSLTSLSSLFYHLYENIDEVILKIYDWCSTGQRINWLFIKKLRWHVKLFITNTGRWIDNSIMATVAVNDKKILKISSSIIRILTFCSRLFKIVGVGKILFRKTGWIDYILILF